MAIDQDAWKAAAAKDPLACPRCLRSDKVEKVSHVVQAGQSSGFYAGPTRSYSAEHGITYGRAAMYGSSSTELAQQLALPPAPHYRSPWKHWWMWLLLAFLAYTTVVSVGTFFSTISSDNFPGTAQALIGTGVGTGILAVLFPLTLWLVNREAKRRQRAYRLMTPIWEKAKRTWDGLYYCARNGGVFTPPGDGGTTFTPAADTLSHLFDHGESVRRAGLTYNDIKTL